MRKHHNLTWKNCFFEHQDSYCCHKCWALPEEKDSEGLLPWWWVEEQGRESCSQILFLDHPENFQCQKTQLALPGINECCERDRGGTLCNLGQLELHSSAKIDKSVCTWIVSSVRGTDSDVLVYSLILSSALSEKASSIVKSGFLKGILSCSSEKEARMKRSHPRTILGHLLMLGHPANIDQATSVSETSWQGVEHLKCALQMKCDDYMNNVSHHKISHVTNAESVSTLARICSITTLIIVLFRFSNLSCCLFFRGTFLLILNRIFSNLFS